MFVELFGLPGSGKTTTALLLADRGWPTVKIRNRLTLAWYAALFAVEHPVKTVRLFALLVRHGGSVRLFYLKFMNLLMRPAALYMKASGMRRAILDQGFFQSALSLFEDPPSGEALQSLLRALPNPDCLLVLMPPEEVRLSRLAGRDTLPRQEFGEKYAQRFASSREKIFVSAFSVIEKKIPDRILCATGAQEATRIILDTYQDTTRPVSHIDRIEERLPDLPSRNILDVGAGRGKFLFAAATRGMHAVGLEKNPYYIASINSIAQKKGIAVDVTEGVAESMPFDDETFGFANIGEVFEHVIDPQKLLSELHRVLTPDGTAYLSVPNRFGFLDPHYHLPFVNWLPRTLGAFVIRAFGLSKQGGEESGRQRLEEMHYATYRSIRDLAYQQGFSVSDIRMDRIDALSPWLLRIAAKAAYLPIRFLYLDTFHLWLKKEPLALSYITIARMPTEKAHGVSIARMCAEFAKSGEDVSLVIPERENPLTATVFDYYGVSRNFSVGEIPSSDFVGRGYTNPLFFFLQRILFLLNLKKIAFPPGIIYTREPEIAWLFSNSHRAVFEAHRWPGGLAGRFQAFLVRHATLVVCNSHGTEETAKRYGVRRTLVAPNGFDPALFEKKEKISRTKLGLPDGMLALYAGSDNPGKGVDIVRAAAKKMEPGTVSVGIIGTGKKQISPPLYEMGRVSPADVPAYLMSADILILPTTRENEESERFTSPIKLFEYLAAGKPIIASDVPPIREILTDDDALFVPPGDPAALAKAIMTLAKNVVLRKKLSQRAKELSVSYTWGARAKRIFEALHV